MPIINCLFQMLESNKSKLYWVMLIQKVLPNCRRKNLRKRLRKRCRKMKQDLKGKIQMKPVKDQRLREMKQKVTAIQGILMA